MNGVITTVGTTSMFIHVEITDGETEPLFNGKGASSLVGRIKESSVCVADGGRIPGCPCDSDSLCMTKCSCSTAGCGGTCEIPTFPIGVFDPDGPQDLMLTVADSGNRNMDNVLAFEPAFYGTTQAAGSLLYGKSSQNTMLIHPSTRSGHIDSDLAVTNVDSFTLNLGELTMITGVVLMAAPAPEVRAAYNYVKNDDGVIWGPAPDYQGCQAQCDICNLEEDDSDPDTITCRCRSWTYDSHQTMCGLSRVFHPDRSNYAGSIFTSGHPSGEWDGTNNVPRGEKIESFRVTYTDKNGNTGVTIKSLVEIDHANPRFPVPLAASFEEQGHRKKVILC